MSGERSVIDGLMLEVALVSLPGVDCVTVTAVVGRLLVRMAGVDEELAPLMIIIIMIIIILK